jgi:hypothetical protein
MGKRFAQGGSLSILDTVVRSTWIARHEVYRPGYRGGPLG